MLIADSSSSISASSSMSRSASEKRHDCLWVMDRLGAGKALRLGLGELAGDARFRLVLSFRRLATRAACSL